MPPRRCAARGLIAVSRNYANPGKFSTMPSISNPAPAGNSVTDINPIQVVCYPDTLRVWTNRPFSRGELKALWQWCECIKPIDCYHDDCIVRQVLVITRPALPALELLAKRHHAHLSYLEIALDWDFGTRLECETARALLDQHHVKAYQRKKLKWFLGTRYTNRRGSGNNLAIYSSKLSRISKSFCVHLDWRITGAGALRAAGLATIEDLIQLDPVEFWRTRLRLYALDLRELGRLYNVKVMKRRRRGYCVQTFPGLPFTYDWDQHVGHVLYYAFGDTSDCSVQEVVTQYRKQLNVKRCLTEFEVGHLRPKSHSQYNNIYSNVFIQSKSPNCSKDIAHFPPPNPTKNPPSQYPQSIDRRLAP